MPYPTKKPAAKAARAAAVRRQRIIRLGASLLALALVAGIAIFSAGSSGGDKTGGDKKDTAAPTDPPTTEPLPEGCVSEATTQAAPRQYQKPRQVLEKDIDYQAVVHTSCGDLEIDLLEDSAPVTVNNFVFLAQEGYFDGLIWHRVVKNFVVQSGDPDGVNGQEPDGPGYAIKDELPKTGKGYIFGTVAMANSGVDSGGSQFFIVTHLGPKGEPEPANLNPLYSIFGKVSERSYEVLERLDKLPTQGGDDPAEADKPVEPIYIDEIEILNLARV